MSPYAGLAYANGYFYGTTSTGGSTNNGTVFRVTSSGTENVLHSFLGSDGSLPESAVLEVNGTLYGMTLQGGSTGDGTVFKISASGTGFKVLHNFSGKPDGRGPQYDSFIDVNGALYGVTAHGGTSDDGTVFKISTTGTETVLYSFQNSNDGRTPFGALLNVNGTLFGTASGGGLHFRGTVYSIHS